MEFGALICKPKEPKCSECKIKKMCCLLFYKLKIKLKRKIKIHLKSYDIFCYLKKIKNK